MPTKKEYIDPSYLAPIVWYRIRKDEIIAKRMEGINPSEIMAKRLIKYLIKI